MKFVAVLNKDIALGKTLNALAHMSVGLGHRIGGLKTASPGVKVLFSDAEGVKAFRATARAIEEESKAEEIHLLASDFTETMTVDTAAEQLERSKSTTEADMLYYAACVVTEDPILEKFAHLNDCVTEYEGYASSEPQGDLRLKIKPDITYPESIPDVRLAMVITKKTPLEELLNEVVINCLKVGSSADMIDLRLMNFEDADGNQHCGISYHPFPVVTAAAAKHSSMTETLQKLSKATTSNVAYSGFFKTVKEKQKGKGMVEVQKPTSSVAFGSNETLDNAIPRKATSLFSVTLNESKLKVAENTFCMASGAGAGAGAGRGSIASAFKKSRDPEASDPEASDTPKSISPA